MTNLYAAGPQLRAADMQDLFEALRGQRARSIDVVVPGRAVQLDCGQLILTDIGPVIDENWYTDVNGGYRFTRKGEAGLASKLDIPERWLRKLRAEDLLSLYDQSVNTLAGREPESAKYLVRLVQTDPDPCPVCKGDRNVPWEGHEPLMTPCRECDGTGQAPRISDGYVRAFLSNGYRMIDSLDVLAATIKGIGDADITVETREGNLTDDGMDVKLWSPQIVQAAPELLRGYRTPFEDGGQGGRAQRAGNGGWSLERARAAAAREGLGFPEGQEPVVSAGLVIRNSDTGLGTFSLSFQVVVLACRNGLTIGGEIARRHVGARLDEGLVKASAQTQQANLKLITSQVEDAVREWMTPAHLATTVKELEADAGTPVRDAARTIEVLAKPCGFTEGECASIFEHFLMGGQVTAGGIAQAVSSVAQTLPDADRARELEGSAVRAMSLAAQVARR